jgi:hypothetical protein
MAVEKIKATMEWKCPWCGLLAKGTLTMNTKANDFFETSWSAHLKDCRTKPQANQNGANQP